MPLDQPIRTLTSGDHWILVEGDRYRPLTLRENARAMGFPDDYEWPADATRREVILGFANAVCPQVARDLYNAIQEQAA